MFRERTLNKHSETKQGIIHVLHTQNFPKKQHFLKPDTHTYLCVSGGKKYYFFRKVLRMCCMNNP